ncbi:hypothetical protein Q8A67_023499 [Cirrhinus molitorella]|uniref:Cytochrome c oxidase assembly factor 4 homolog n=1 Tax=Cirrhinus molitorella TaxID=172907 RepID=A0AA88PE08_9TELE|nr:hypothetical protein Q8A67_023499 [Cirrhinus molitorella]
MTSTSPSPHNRSRSEDEDDPVDGMISRTGCAQLHYALQDCMAEQQDWRKCQTEVQKFKDDTLEDFAQQFSAVSVILPRRESSLAHPSVPPLPARRRGRTPPRPRHQLRRLLPPRRQPLQD